MVSSASRHDAGLQQAGLPPLGLFGTTLLFGGAGILLFAVTYGLIPALSERTGVELVVLWFVGAGLGLFVPLIFATPILLRSEGGLERIRLWHDRLRFRPMDAADWTSAAGGLVAIGLLAAGSMIVLRSLFGDAHLHPSFMKMEPLAAGRYWILAAWLPFWIVNIMGEEILWRGVVLPRQEVAFGRWAWVVNGTAWLLFHLPFGPAIMFTLAPTTFLLPFIVQRRRNSWIGVLIHAGLNGPGFLAVAFGLV